MVNRTNLEMDVNKMMPGHDEKSHGCMQPQDMMIEKMWDKLSEDQKKK